MDDVWSIDVWDNVKRYLPNNDNQSRVVVTTRLSNVANQCSTSNLTMKFLDEDTSWNLLCQNVFAQESCPLELQGIGKKIAKNCGGLPLAIVTIGGLLAKFDMSPMYWNHVAESVRSTVNLDSDGHCLKVLYSSYKGLPVHLKPCLLYMGMFPEDHEMRASKIYKFWAAEGFLKPIRGKSLKETAEVHLTDLVERNLILVRKWGTSGKVKVCYIHDFITDLCLKEGQRSKFFYVMTHSRIDQQHMRGQRHFTFYRASKKPNDDLVNHLSESTLLIASLIGAFRQVSPFLHRLGFCRTSMNVNDDLVNHFPEATTIVRSLTGDSCQVLPIYPSKFLRVLNEVTKFRYTNNRNGNYPINDINHFINSRYVATSVPSGVDINLNPLICSLRNLQTLVVRTRIGAVAPSEIWNMLQLVHIKVRNIHLPKPPMNPQCRSGYIVLENLETLMTIENFQFDGEVIKRIPNVRKLKVLYHASLSSVCSYHSLRNLGCLQKLESLTCHFYTNKSSLNLLPYNFSLPRSLKKLTLYGSQFYWEDMSMIGSLPQLEVLKLLAFSFQGHEWTPIEGQFQCLKYLSIGAQVGFEIWNVEWTHFPRLEQLVLGPSPMLKEIPLDIGQIPTLRLIEIMGCSVSLIISVRNIIEEQEELGNVGLQLKLK